MLSTPPRAITEEKKEVGKRYKLIAQALSDRRKREKEEEKKEARKIPSPALCWDGPEDFGDNEVFEEEEGIKLVPFNDTPKKIMDNAGGAPRK